MYERRWFYLVLSMTVVLSLGAVTNQLAPLAAAGTALSDEGIAFPDGTVQTTAFSGTGELVQGRTTFDINQVDDCSGFENLIIVPTGRVLEISWISVEIYSPSIVDPARVSIRTWTGPGASIDHPLVRLTNPIKIGAAISYREGWHSEVSLTSVPEETVQVRGCKDGSGSFLNVTVTFSGRLYDLSP